MKLPGGIRRTRAPSPVLICALTLACAAMALLDLVLLAGR
jgi:hypothetical protein